MGNDLPERLAIERQIDPTAADTLAQDVVRGFCSAPKWLPCKHLYDEAGGRLFEQICCLPEYYPARVERALLARHAGEVVEATRPAALVELGSGSSRKTRLLLEALGRANPGAFYLPIDIDEAMLRASSAELLVAFPWLHIRGLVADFESPLEGLPRGPEVLAVFLGGTIGNFDEEGAGRLLSGLARALGPGAGLLIGTDMHKDPRRLTAAYDDRQGVTARFNLNLLEVLNRKLGAHFVTARFRHLARYDLARRQIEMHLRSLAAQRVCFDRLGLEVGFEAGELVRTEISRKFTPLTGRRMLEGAGFEVRERFASPGEEFSLWLARVAG